MKKRILLFMLLCGQLASFGQSVGVNTTVPQASAALDIQSDEKGVLIPRVFLISVTDNTTVPAPAPTLLVYNTNPDLPHGTGFYFNDNTPQSPGWKSVASWSVPFYAAESHAGASFEIIAEAAGSTAIKGFGANNATGVHAESASGKALIVDGYLKIAGDDDAPAAAGKILTSDATGNASWQGAVAFKATGIKGSGSEKMQGGTTKIPFATEEYDLQNNYTNANQANHSTFTAPVKGIYHFDALVSWEVYSNDVDDDHSIWVFLRRTRNGVTTELNSSQFAIPGKNGRNVSGDFQLEPGDQVAVYFSFVDTDAPYWDLTTVPEASFFNGRLVKKL